MAIDSCMQRLLKGDLPATTPFFYADRSRVAPDACFYILNYQRTIGRRRLQPDDPPPDFAIETDVISKTTIDAYLAIGVPEVWVSDRGRFRIYVLQDGEYVESDISPNFPGIAIAQLIPATVERAWQVGNCQALEEFESAIGRSS